jgi:hypothetical protein
MPGRLTPQFSGGALLHVTWHFIVHGRCKRLLGRMVEDRLCELGGDFARNHVRTISEYQERC